MNDELKQNFDRIIAARERLLEIRADRINTIYRLQGYLRARLDDFFTNVDPIGGSRLADLGAEGSKAAGDMALVLAMFDGARMKIAVDGLGRFSHEASPNVFEGIGEIVGFEISPDNLSATLDYVPAGSSNARPMRTSFDALVDRLVKSTLDATEAQVSSGGPRPVAPVSAVPPVAAMHPPQPPHTQPAPALHAVPPPEVPRIARAAGAEDLSDFIEANPMRRREEAPSYLTEAPAPNYRVEAPAPAPVASPAPSYRPEAPAPSYLTEAPAPSYRTEAPAPSYRPEAPAPSYRPDAPGPTFRSDAPGPSYRAEGPSSRTEMSAPSSRIEMSSSSSYDNVRSIDSMSSLPTKPRGLTFSVR